MDVMDASMNAAAQRQQITMSPYYGMTDFSGLPPEHGHARLDPVSLADLLRNGFVYPPHSIYRDTKVATFGFDPRHDMHGTPEFRFAFPRRGHRASRGEDGNLLETYDRLLCDAFAKSCADIRSPWLLQSGGKDSTQLAIIASEVRPDTTCVTYLGGSEENEVDSASYVAKELGLRHETLACDPGRAYDRYVALVPKMPLLTADFALLSYVDLATYIAASGGDGIVDGMGADNYFGIPVGTQHRWISRLARGLRLPGQMCEWPLIGQSFELCYLLSTLQMDQIERDFPGSRFTDAEVDDLFGRRIATQSHARLELFQREFATADNDDERVAMALTVAGATGGFAKGLYTASALSLRSAYPFCDPDLREWVYRQVPSDQLVDPVTRTSKVLMRKHIATRFRDLPYVARKGSFRFNVCGLAKARFDQVHAYAVQGRDILPGAVDWLERNRRRLDNKYHASKFYLLAVVLPWVDRLVDRTSH